MILTRRHSWALSPVHIPALIVTLALLPPAGPTAAGSSPSNASCTYDMTVLIDPGRGLLRGEGSFLFRFMEQTNSQSPLAMSPVFQVTDVQAGESGLSRELALDPGLKFKWEGWPDPNQIGLGPLTHISQDYIVFGPEFLWYPVVVDPRTNTSGKAAISVPERFHLVTDGSLISEESQFGFRKSTFNFATMNGRPRLLVMTLYPVVQDTFRTVSLRAVVSPAHQAAIPGLMDRVRTILREYEGYFGPYKFPTLTIVEAPQAFGGDYLLGTDIAGLGMTGVVLVASDQLEGRLDDELLAHEIAHQWWGCQVGPSLDDKAGGLWMMEGMAEFATLLHGEIAGGETLRHEQLAEWARHTRAISEKHGDQALHALDPERQDEKVGFAYCRAPYVFEMMRQRLGTERFRGVFADLMPNWAGFRMSTSDLLSELNKRTGQDWQEFFDQWVYRKSLPRLEVTYASERQADGRWLVRVNCRQSGTPFHLVVPIRVFTGPGSTDSSLDLSAASQSMELTVDTEPTALVVDPDATFLCSELAVTRVDALQMK